MCTSSLFENCQVNSRKRLTSQLTRPNICRYILRVLTARCKSVLIAWSALLPSSLRSLNRFVHSKPKQKKSQYDRCKFPETRIAKKGDCAIPQSILSLSKSKRSPKFPSFMKEIAIVTLWCHKPPLCSECLSHHGHQ